MLEYIATSIDLSIRYVQHVMNFWGECRVDIK